MPVVETHLPKRTTRDDKLVLALISELQNPKLTGQPVIAIRQFDRGARHVTVIWDKWEACDPQIRPKIIREAFAQFHGSDYEKTIAVVFGATVEEAVLTGMLPFEVKPFRWQRLDETQKKTSRKAMADEGAVYIGSSTTSTLRFRTLDEAESAVARLHANAPGIEWGIVQMVDSPD